MSLADAAALLGVAPNSVRSRFKNGKLRGERDNQGKIWVWLEPESARLEGSKSKASKPVVEAALKGSIKPSIITALEAHNRTLTEQLGLAQAELATLRSRASTADRLEAEIAGLEVLRDELRADRDHWREFVQHAEQQTSLGLEHPRGCWTRLFGRWPTARKGSLPQRRRMA